MACIFCDIVEGKANADILYQNDFVISFLDIRPMNYGHSLVIPKKHFDSFLEIPAKELSALINGVQVVFKAMNDSLKPDGINIVSNNGSAAGQSVPHFHFHIIPRFHSDEFKIRLNLKSYKGNSQKDFAEKIRTCLPGGQAVSNI
ncbi:MAG TPA: HIT family protein [Ignavibacteriaceae bacterium]|nr:HIT family protein [Ignavibacteriaceae bacterium]